jgi:hypothetical protein
MKIESVVLRGKLNFIDDPESTFKGPIIRGMRPTAWFTNLHGEVYILSYAV